MFPDCIRCYHLEPTGFWVLQEKFWLSGITVKPAVPNSSLEANRQIEISFSDFNLFDLYKNYYADAGIYLVFTRYTYTHSCTFDYRTYIEWLHSHGFSISNRLLISSSPLIIQFYTYTEDILRKYYNDWNNRS